MYDAIIVGARCAGSPTAMLLARKGYRVLLLDRTDFPSDTVSTHMMWKAGGSRLRRWGLMERLLATGCRRPSRMTLDFGNGLVLSGTPPAFDGEEVYVAPRRTVLDKLLLDAAIEAGVEFRDRFTVEDLIRDGDAVAGIRGHGRGGSTVEERAKIVIGADGRNSVIAKMVDAPKYNEKPAVACYYYSYWSGLKNDGDWQGYGMVDTATAAWPTNDGLMLVLAAWKYEEFPRVRTDIEGNFMAVVDQYPEFAEDVRGGRREERFVGIADLPAFFRQPYGPGWALVGDAGYHKDPVTAQGISDAFRDAERLSEAIDDGFAGRRPLDEALAEYQRLRDEEVEGMYEFTYELARMDPPTPEQEALFGALEGNQAQIDRFFGAFTSAVPVGEFFSDENVEAIMSGAS
jgi:flavin-dependent dehydrogenase